MSFEVYVQSFKDGKPGGLARGRVRDAFGTFLVESEPNLWRLRYDATNTCDIFVVPHDGDETLIDSFTVGRPGRDERL